VTLLHLQDRPWFGCVCVCCGGRWERLEYEGVQTDAKKMLEEVDSESKVVEKEEMKSLSNNTSNTIQ
jgi:hypothetical protein